jgi:hypothetical protein
MGASAVEAAYGAGVGGKSGTILTPAASFPACVFRAKFGEAAGTNLADATGGITDLTITVAGTGNAFVNAGAFTTSPSVGNEVYAQETNASPASVRTIGAKSLLLLADIHIESTTATSWILAVGTNSSPSVMGYSIVWDGTNNRFQFQVIGTSGVAQLVNFTETPAGLEGTRCKVAILWDRTAGSLGSVSLYVNGVLVVTKAFSADPGNINIENSANGIIRLGRTNAGVLMPVRYFDASIWTPATIPADFALTMARWAAMSYEFPQGLSGVALAA